MTVPPLHEEPIWIGVDWGGSGFRAWRVEPRGSAPLALGVVGKPLKRAWGAGFAPVPLDQQLLEREAGGMSLTDAESREGRDRVGLVARAVERLSKGAELVRVAVAAPGLRARAGRGLVVVRNGPRVPDLAPRLAERLDRDLGPRFLALEPLIGDGLACAWGELAGVDGALREARCAYSLAGGSGLAEAFVVAGRPRALDGLAGVEKAWAARDAAGASFEERLAPAHLGGVEARLERRAEAGDERARARLEAAAAAFGELVERRAAELERLFDARLERVVVGQALGAMLASAWFRERMEAALAARPALAGVALVVSELRAAPALGAVAAALDAEGASSV